MSEKEKSSGKNLGGRPTRLTEDFIEKFVAAVKAVLTYKRACEMCSLHKSSFYAYLDQAEKDKKDDIESIHTRFSDAVKKARSEKAQQYIKTIENREKNWQANAWLLERCFREDYGTDSDYLREFLAKSNALEEKINLLMNKKNHQIESNLEKEVANDEIMEKK